MHRISPLLLFAGLVLASPLSAQRDASAQADLQLDGVYGGTTAELRLHSTEIGQPAAMAFGAASVTQLSSRDALMLIKPHGATIFQGIIGPDGTFQVDVPLAVPAYPGVRFFAQGGVMHRDGFWVGSHRKALIGEAAGPSFHLEHATSLPGTVANRPTDDLATGDIDRDGDLDLILATAMGSQVLINQDGVFTDETDARLPGGKWIPAMTVAFGDVDLDGDQDLLAGGGIDLNGIPLDTYLWFNDGNGNFFHGIPLLTGMPTSSAAFGDLDGDGLLDLVLTHSHHYLHQVDHPSTILFNRTVGGQVSFVEDAVFAAASFNNATLTQEVILGDVDRDGDLDIYLAKTGNGGEVNRLFLNDGAGVFSDASSSNLPAINWGDGDKSSGCAFADVNGDGWLDIVVANGSLTIDPADSADLLINRGASDPGVFDDAPLNLPDAYDPFLPVRLGVETGDVDLDGDTDIILTPMEWFGPGPNGTVGIPTLYLNGGGAQGGTEGIFAKDWSFLPTTEPFMVHRASLFDADGDGDLDFYSCGFGSITGSPAGFQDHFFLNLIP